MLTERAASALLSIMSAVDGSRNKTKAKCAFSMKRKLGTLKCLNRSGLCRNTSRKYLFRVVFGQSSLTDSFSKCSCRKICMVYGMVSATATSELATFSKHILCSTTGLSMHAVVARACFIIILFICAYIGKVSMHQDHNAGCLLSSHCVVLCCVSTQQ